MTQAYTHTHTHTHYEEIKKCSHTMMTYENLINHYVPFQNHAIVFNQQNYI